MNVEPHRVRAGFIWTVEIIYDYWPNVIINGWRRVAGSFKNNRKLFPTWSHTLFFCLISYCERQGGRDLIISGNNKKSNMYNGPIRVHIDLLAMCIIDAGSRRIPLSDPPQSNWKNLLFFLVFFLSFFTLPLCRCVCVCVENIVTLMLTDCCIQTEWMDSAWREPIAWACNGQQ